ncbi:site-specific integrase [Lampropedia aestuarii]|nr:site-specific integrase [Lampropedia aestuarii]
MKRQDIERRPMPDAVIESLEPEAQMYREHHADGVYLRVMPNGMKDWQLHYQREDGTWSWLELGNFGKAQDQLTGQFARQMAIELIEEAKSRGVPLLPANAPAPAIMAQPAFAQLDSVLVPGKSAPFPHVSAAELPALLRALRAYSVRPMAIGLQLLLLLGVRPAELRAAEWAEFDLAAGLWNVAAGRHKQREDFLLPLPTQAIQLLHELHAHRTTGPFLFPGRSKSLPKPVGNMAFNHALDRLGYKGRQTPNGLRTLLSAAAQAAGKDHRIVDSAYVHKRKKAAGTGNQQQTLSQRLELLQWWAAELDAMVAAPMASI